MQQSVRNVQDITQLIFSTIYKGSMCPLNQKFMNRRYALSPKYRTAKTEMSWHFKSKWNFTAINIPVDVKIETHYPHKHDVDAFIKIILDSLQHGGVLENDSLVRCLTVARVISKDYCGCEIEIHAV